jgi:hypothetical protein
MKQRTKWKTPTLQRLSVRNAETGNKGGLSDGGGSTKS